ncbi:hypothetical protein [Azospirillum agricola]|uniref:hypothetical protein n=1 Tax=Azospirillum agricola TaxID=1720247 RepID=UPI00267A6EA1|nr:hypothetical protein [Azospirillum agricola]
MTARISWEGVFPAVTTQFREDLSLDVDATAKVIDALVPRRRVRPDRLRHGG